MSTNDQMPDPTPVEATTAAPAAQAAPPVAYQPAPQPPHRHGAGTGVIVAAIVVGALFFAMLAFGAGFGIRGAIDRHMGARGGSIQRGYDGGYMMGQPQGGPGGCPGYDQERGGMMQGFPQSQRGDGWNSAPQDRLNRGPGWTVPDEQSVPSTPAP